MNAIGRSYEGVWTRVILLVVGPILFKLHYSFLMGHMEIQKILKKVKTVEEDRLPCPFCLAGVLG